MQIAYHLGAHCTGEEALMKCLLKNRGLLAEEGIAVPGPARYRTLLRDTVNALSGQPASPDTEEMLIEQILDDEAAERMVLSFDSFMAFPRWALGRGKLYPGATNLTRGLARAFPSHEIEFHLAIRNPATFLPALLKKQRGKSYEEFIEGTDPLLLDWSELIGRIAGATPEIPLTVWCDEDTPLIWPEVLREVSGHDPYTRLDGTHDIVAAIIEPEGLERMIDYLATHPPQTEIQRRRIVSAFLDKFGLDEAIEIELDLPGWTEDYVEALTARYEDDLHRIARMPGVHFIAP
ncbi:MAG: hypothetical protein WDA23_00940 [Gemmobacter sp.]